MYLKLFTQTARFQLLSWLTDHHPIILDFDPLPRNSSWRCRDTLLKDQTFMAALYNTLASTIQGFKNQLTVPLQFLQLNISYKNYRSTDILTQIITNIRKIDMSHMSAIAKECSRGKKHRKLLYFGGKEVMDITSGNQEQIKLEETSPSW